MMINSTHVTPNSNMHNIENSLVIAALLEKPLILSSRKFHDSNNNVELLETFSSGAHERLNDVD